MPTAGPTRRPRPPVSPIRWRKNWCCICACARPAPPPRPRSPTSCSATPTGPRRRCWSSAVKKPSPRTPTTPRSCSPSATSRRRHLAAAMLRCAEATANAGRIADADALARQAWVDAIDTPAAEAAFLHRWAGVATADDQWARFQRLAWLSDPSAAARQVARLDPAHHAAAEARLAAKRDDPQTEALVAALPPALQADPGLILDRARVPAPRRPRHRGGRPADPDAGCRQSPRVLGRTEPAGAQAAA